MTRGQRGHAKDPNFATAAFGFAARAVGIVAGTAAGAFVVLPVGVQFASRGFVAEQVLDIAVGTVDAVDAVAEIVPGLEVAVGTDLEVAAVGTVNFVAAASVVAAAAASAVAATAVVASAVGAAVVAAVIVAAADLVAAVVAVVAAAVVSVVAAVGVAFGVPVSAGFAPADHSSQ